jgi:alanyl-tRNA synthetase
MTVRELREKYLRFFESKGHLLFPAASLVPYDVTGRLDESLLFTGAGMIQFKPYFRGLEQPENTRLTTCQRCVRTGDIGEVGDDSHLTFFEMLGNFSFGDYFKAQAIAYSWEFLTSPEWLALDPRRLSFSVFQEDEEAFTEWSFWITPTGQDPKTRIFRLGEETNYWPAGAFTKGPPGPCGPNSEMFYWVSDEEPPSGSYSPEEWSRDEAAGKWLEIWNDVFIQFEWQGRLRNPSRPAEGYEKEAMPPLPFRSIDTGMGLDRTAVVLGGYKSVYDTDVFAPIFAKIDSVAGDTSKQTSAERVRKARRIIADHIRTAAFCIMDGILPSNTGRGYVLRRLIRRAVLQGQRQLGIERPFFFEIFDGVQASMGDFYPDLSDKRDVIVETLKNEEHLFRRTLSKGLGELRDHFDELLINYTVPLKHALTADRSFDLPLSSNLRGWLEAEEALAPKDDGFFDRHFQERYDWDSVETTLAEMSRVGEMVGLARPVLSGYVAFFLYDTFGFPLEVVQEVAAEAGVDVDVEGYESNLLEAQERSRGSTERESVYGGLEAAAELSTPEAEATVFVGYAQGEATARVVRIRKAPDASKAELLIALDRTPFYGESGGQTGDRGMLSFDDGSMLEVINTTKSSGVYWHHAVVTGANHVPDSDAPLANLTNPIDEVDSAGAGTRELDQYANLLGQTVVARVEGSRRQQIQRNHTATHLLQAALRRTLGNHVTQAGSYVGPESLRFDFTHGKALSPDELATIERIVNEQALANTSVETHVDIPIAEARARGAMALFGEKYGDKVRMVEVGEFSRELCGGTHVRSTGELGLFKIMSESSAASGVRRIEAITGEAAYQWALAQANIVKEAATALKTSPAELQTAILRQQEQLKEERRKRERAEMAALGGAAVSEDQAKDVGSGVALWVRNFGPVDQKIAAQALDNHVANEPNLVGLVAVLAGDKVNFIAKAGANAVKAGAHAGNLVRDVAKIAGGGGGGRPDFATAGGKDASKVDDALSAAAEVLKSMLGHEGMV